MKKVLVCSTDVMMYLFLIPHVNKLIADGYSVDLACSYADEYKSENYKNKILDAVDRKCKYYSINSVRSPYSLKNFSAYCQLQEIIEHGNYDLIWANEPVVGFLTRLASRKARKLGSKVLYLVHGFHFFKGGPVTNWFFYPFEKIASLFTDVIVTINKQDYNFAKKYFNVTCEYIPGIGFPHAKYANTDLFDSLKKRSEFGFTKDDIVILAVGELLPRKNHKTLIKAFSEMPNKTIKLLICGIGGLQSELKNLACELMVEDRVYFAGQRYDINEILKSVNVFIHPSIREGLGMAPLEAMAAGLPIITSNVQGIPDYSVDGVTGFVCDPFDTNCYTNALNKLVDSQHLREEFGKNNVERSKVFDIENSLIALSKIINRLHDTI